MRGRRLIAFPATCWIVRQYTQREHFAQMAAVNAVAAQGLRPCAGGVFVFHSKGPMARSSHQAGGKPKEQACPGT